MRKILKHGWPLKLFFSGALIIPLSSSNDWKILSFNKIPSHIISFSEAGMKVTVKKSAAPLIYKFPEIKTVNSIEARGRIKGKIKLKGKQGEKGQDDFLLRVGLVVKGQKTLNFVQRSIAPKWVKELHELAPNGQGIDHIEFFNIITDPGLLGKSRRHPLSDLLYENFFWLSEGEGEFHFRAQLQKSLETTALWLSIDGDDTESDFELELTSLVLN